MIIKSKSYKHDTAFKTVVAYLLRESEREDGFVLTRFIEGKDLSADEISRQFLDNEKYRKNPRKNNVKLFMEILSFHSGDSKHLSNDKLKKIARKYMSLRSPLSVSLATVHRKEKDHVHLHVLFSGCEYRTGRSVRVSRNHFRDNVKVPAEKYVREQFPELECSAIDHKKASPSKKKY